MCVIGNVVVQLEQSWEGGSPNEQLRITGEAFGRQSS